MSKRLPLAIYLFINIAVVVICYYYPVTRDEFYYLNGSNGPNAFEEYLDSYLHVNPRIGQFFTNWVSRNHFVEIIFGLLLFNSFFWVFFLSIYRRRVNFAESSDIKRIIVIIAFFTFIINYFGEMFFYVPFSTNYTFLQVFYLIYVYIITEYYTCENNLLKKKLALPVIIFLGIFTGAGNEHVPPVLLLVSAIMGLFFLIKKRKFPSLEIVVYGISILIGYLYLFFAPANKIKLKNVGQEELGFNIHSYLQGFIKIAKLIYYYNLQLVIILGVSILFLLIFRKKFDKISVYRILTYFVTGLLCIPIVAYSPLVGTRLLFFTNCMWIIVILMMFGTVFSKKLKEIAYIFGGAFLIAFFSIGMIISIHANNNYKKVNAEIEIKRKKGNSVTLEESFNYNSNQFGGMNRRILLESGQDYIDNDSLKDSSVERNLKLYYHLKSISVEDNK